MGGLIPKATVPINDNHLSVALAGLNNGQKTPLSSEGLRLIVCDVDGKLTAQSPREPCTVGKHGQEILCEDLLAIQDLYSRGRGGKAFGWSFLGFELKASAQILLDAEEVLRREGLLFVRYGLMVLPHGEVLDLATNYLPSGVSISHPLWLPQSWFATPWEARTKAQEISDVIQSVTGEAVNLSACYAYFCISELAREQTPASS